MAMQEPRPGESGGGPEGPGRDRIVSGERSDRADQGGVEVAPGVRVPADAIEVQAVRSSGPGGQNVNKRATKVQLRIGVDAIPIARDARARLRRLAKSSLTAEGDLLIASDEARSQLGNRRVCMQRLRELIVRAKVKPKKRIPTKPSRGAVERRIKAKKERSEKKRRRGWEPGS